MEDNKKWFKEAKFGLMIHWGLYALPAGEWKGKRQEMGPEGVSEWLQYHFRIPCREYERLAQAFNPIYFNAEEWVELAEAAGMKYIVMTSKHHDGFAMYDSATDDFNIVKKTPFGRDVIKELADACKKHNMKFGLYYSQELDWHEENGGGYALKEGDEEAKSNDWDFPDDSKKDFSVCFEKKIKPQLKEILTNYGELALIWFDMPHVITPEQSDELYDMVKKYQPNCLINSRIGNGKGDYRSCGDNEIPNESVGDELVEAPTTLNTTWGYKTFDNEWKDADKVREIKKHLNDRGINYLLNVGPDYLGRIPVMAEKILRAVGKNK